MKQPNRPKEYREHDPLPPELEPEGVASAQECTGLMFTPPKTGDQWEAYRELSPMEIPRRDPAAPGPGRKLPGKAAPREPLG